MRNRPAASVIWGVYLAALLMLLPLLNFSNGVHASSVDRVGRTETNTIAHAEYTRRRTNVRMSHPLSKTEVAPHTNEYKTNAQTHVRDNNTRTRRRGRRSVCSSSTGVCECKETTCGPGWGWNDDAGYCQCMG